MSMMLVPVAERTKDRAQKGRGPNFPTLVSGTSIVLAFGVSALVGLISGILPAVRAARLEPVEALRSER